MKILLIDNYDSFTYNLYHYLSSLKCKVDVYRNDKIEINKIKRNKYKKIIISPGPGNPDQAGNCLKIVKYFYKTIPILGVCLGHQVIGQVFKSKIIGIPFESAITFANLSPRSPAPPVIIITLLSRLKFFLSILFFYSINTFKF